MLFHFDIPIYKPGWNWRSGRDVPTPEMYNPSKLDTDQWMEAAKAMGARCTVLVAKHCSGFLQWQSDLYPYGVKQSPWRIGNEQGVAAYPCWATVPDRQDYNGPGDPDGRYWLPGKCDVPIRNHEWFWTPNAEQKLYSVEQLMDMYYRSVGRNCNLLLNANPNPEGLVPEADFQRHVEFGKEIRRRFDKPLAQTEGRGDMVELKLAASTLIDHVIVMEDIGHGERIREYQIEGMVGVDTWQTLCTGQSVGHKRIQQLDPREIGKVRLRVLKSAAEPLIRSLAVYRVG